MERQLSVWAAPGLILFLALLAFVFGHPPGAGAPGPAPSVAARPSEPPPPVTALPASKPAAVPPKAKAEGQHKPVQAPAAPPASEKPVAAPAQAAAEAEAEKPAAEPPAPAAEIAKTGDGPTGKVVGRIVFEGPPPKPSEPIAVPAAQREQCCADGMDTRDPSTLLVSADGGVADVVVTIKAAGAEADGAGQTFEIDQKCCRFEPHVLLLPAGATVRYLNSDQTNHNVRTSAKKNENRNSNLAAGSSMEVVVSKDEEFPIGCDIHPWMKGYVVSAKFSTADLSDADGRFEIDGVPPGEWAVEVWGERVKAADKKLKVKVEAGATTTVEWRVAATR
jgi:plastocyanin